MNGLATINQLNQRAVEHAEANRILKSHGLPEVAGTKGDPSWVVITTPVVKADAGIVDCE